MNTRYIIGAIAKPKISRAYNEIEQTYHIFNDGSPENLQIIELINEALARVQVLDQYLTMKLGKY